MEKRKFYFGMLVLVLAFAMTVVGCADKSGPNNFEGKSFTMNNDKSVLKFSTNTWTWDNHEMESQGGSKLKYNFRGNYTYSGNTATMTSTDYQTGSYAWTPWAYKWTVTLDSNGKITYKGEGLVKSIISISIDEQTGELEGYQVR
jgi:hypothetical protein